MDHREVGRIWDENAEVWTKLSREGYDIFRDYVNTPAFLAMLPDVTGLSGLDIGCGEGHNTRLLAGAGARMTAIDISRRFMTHAVGAERAEPAGIRYCQASALELPFGDQAFDFATGFMSFMDVPEHDKVVREAHRVLKPGGFLQFSLSHPCFATPRWRWIRNEQGEKVGLDVGDYFRGPDGAIEEWIVSTTPPDERDSLRKFRVPRFWGTLSGWLNLLIDTGFVVEEAAEPVADDEAIEAQPHLACTRIVAFFLILRCRKPR
jgi:SAM-dependent methyltransferase